jgi:serine protease Do
VGGASKVQVLLADGSRFEARVVGTDPKTDLAVVRIDAKKALPHVKFGNSDAVEVGEWVVAIGHPRGLDQTVTTGIISAKHRRGITDPSGYQDFLQTDAAINPGNSGGPLLNLRGEVVGVNAAIASSSGGFEGIGFAIPSNMALYISRELIARGKVERGWLGVSVQDLSYDLSKTMGIEGTRGALVSEVLKASPAEKAGLKQGDVVIAYNGKEIRDASQLRNEAAASPIGKEVKVTIVREGKKREVPVRIESMESRVQATAAPIRDRLGVTVRPAAAKEATRLKLRPGQGVVITRVEAGSPGSKAGLEPGDVILEVNEIALSSPQDLSGALALVKPGQQILAAVVDGRTGERGSLQIKVR